jgi:hypothetical protein
MPTVIDTPERIDYDGYVETHELTTHELTIERPQPRGTRLGFWRTLAYRITTHLTHTPRARQTPSCSAPRPFETPMDRLVRAHPSLAPLALSVI